MERGNRESGNEEGSYYQTRQYTCIQFRKKQTERLYLTLCGVERCAPGYSVGPYAREHYHLHVILSGRGTLKIGDQTWHLHGNQAFLLKPFDTAFYQADPEDPWHYCWLTFDGTAARRCMDAAGFPDGVHVRECYVDAGELLRPLRRLLDCAEPTVSNELRRMSLAMEFLALVIDSNRQGETAVRERTGDSPDGYVEQALDMIHLHYSSIRIGEVARYIGINRSYLTKIFREKMKVSPQEYLLRFRLNLSCDLLLNTNASIQEIAQKVGYENPLTFSKIFKRAYVISPRGFRQNGGAEGWEQPDLPGKALPGEEAAERPRQAALLLDVPSMEAVLSDVSEKDPPGHA